MSDPLDLMKARLSEHRSDLARAVAGAVVGAVAAVGLLSLSGWFLVGAALAGAAGNAAAMAFNYLIPSAFIRLFAIFRTGGRYAERLFSHAAALRSLAAVRSDLFDRLASVDPRRLAGLSASDASTRLLNDLDSLEEHVVRIPVKPAALAAAVLAIALSALAGRAPPFVVGIGFIVLPFLADGIARRFVDLPAAQRRDTLAVLKSRFAQQSRAAADIAIYGMEGKSTQFLMDTAVRTDALERRIARGEALLSGLLIAWGPFLATLVLLTADPAHGRARHALAALATLAASEAFAGWVRARGRDAGMRAGVARIAALATGDPSHGRDGQAGRDLEIGDRRFGHGARVLLTGRTGSGKTRILETFAGLRSDAPQRLAVDGAEVRDIMFEDLAATFALAPQDATLIAGTWMDNLRLARPAIAESEIWEALETACLADMARSLPEGLMTWVGEGGARLSGGERKRLAIARALLARRPWLLLDEPSEGLDRETEARLLGNLERWLDTGGQGLLLVSHRQPMQALARERVRIDAAFPSAT